MTWQFTLTGLLIGALVGMTGMGGGSLMTPILVIVFGFNPTVAVGTDILHGAIFKTFGAVRHRRLGHRPRAARAAGCSLGSAPMSLVGVSLATQPRARTATRQSADGQVLGGALLFGAAGLVREDVRASEGVDDDDRSLSRGTRSPRSRSASSAASSSA